MGLFVFWGQRIPHPRLMSQPIHWVTEKVMIFEWNPERERALKQVHAAVQVAYNGGKTTWKTPEYWKYQ